MSDLNDPRVLFAAERTALAWTRTALTLTAFGFTIERFGLFIHMMNPATAGQPIEKGTSYWTGIAFLALGAFVSLISTLQYRTSLRSLRPIEIPPGYRTIFPAAVNIIVSILAAGLLWHLLLGNPYGALIK